MANPKYRVRMPYYEVSELLELAELIIEKHKADGTGSVLKKLDMADMEAKVKKAVSKHELSEKSRSNKSIAFEHRNLALGIAPHQFSTTRGTVWYYVSSIRMFLMGMFKGNEHQLGDWGFDVDDSPGRGVRIKISRNPVKLMELAGKIVKKHQSDGSRSVLVGFNMADLKSRLAESVKNHELAKQLLRDAEKSTEARNKAIGRVKGLSVSTAGTVLFYVISVRDILLGLYKGSEKALGDWGFDVNAHHHKPHTDEITE